MPCAWNAEAGGNLSPFRPVFRAPAERHLASTISTTSKGTKEPSNAWQAFLCLHGNTFGGQNFMHNRDTSPQGRPVVFLNLTWPGVLFRTMLASSQTSSPLEPLMPLERRSMSRRWLSVPPDTRLKLQLCNDSPRAFEFLENLRGINFIHVLFPSPR